MFKIGITEDLHKRWNNPKYGYRHDGWERMLLLYAAPWSKWKIEPLDSPDTRTLKHESSGWMEIKLIETFAMEGLCNGCVNKPGSGGESASDGKPHFTYVVVKEFD